MPHFGQRRAAAAAGTASGADGFASVGAADFVSGTAGLTPRGVAGGEAGASGLTPRGLTGCMADASGFTPRGVTGAASFGASFFPRSEAKKPAMAPNREKPPSFLGFPAGAAEDLARSGDSVREMIGCSRTRP